MTQSWRRWALALVAAGAACDSVPHDYTAYLEHMPRSILVLPPLNESPDVNASQAFLARITRPLAERGYYVFPVAVVERLMRDNGLPGPFEMHQVPLAKIHEILGADAVLYVTITAWGTSYQVVNSSTQAHARFRLVDVRSGALLWEGEQLATSNSSGGGHDPIGMLLGAVVTQVASSVSDPTPGLAEGAAYARFTNEHDGLLPGPRHPDHEAAVRETRAAMDAAAAAPRHE